MRNRFSPELPKEAHPSDTLIRAPSYWVQLLASRALRKSTSGCFRPSSLWLFVRAATGHWYLLWASISSLQLYLPYSIWGALCEKMFVKPSAWCLVPNRWLCTFQHHPYGLHTHPHTDTHLLPAAQTKWRICLHGACLSLPASRWTGMCLPGFLIGPAALPWMKDFGLSFIT